MGLIPGLPIPDLNPFDHGADALRDLGVPIPKVTDVLKTGGDVLFGIGEKKTNAQTSKSAKAKQQSIAQQFKKLDPNNPADVLTGEFKAFGDFKPAMGPDFLDTQTQLVQELALHQRADAEPAALSPWQCRIGGATFFVPPINISVTQNFHTGSLVGGTLRQPSPPKFNAGHSQTVINMTLYFPNADTVWGFEGDAVNINFDTDPDTKIDIFLSSLRGLITQFKFAPILPVKNAYLNGTFNISAVILNQMTVQTLPNFPFCLAVNLQMFPFNHEVFLPMIDDFNNAIHWGRFRQYMGRAARRMRDVADRSFLTIDDGGVGATNTSPLDSDLAGAQARRASELQQLPSLLQNQTTYSKTYDWESGKNFDLYYPDHDPSAVAGPDTSDFRSPTNADTANPANHKAWWGGLLNLLGIDVGTFSSASFAITKQNHDGLAGNSQLLIQYNALLSFLSKAGLVARTMGPAQLNAFVEQQVRASKPMSENAKRAVIQAAQAAWFVAMYRQFLNDPYLQAILDYQNRRRGWIAIKEWEVPMRKLGLDPQYVMVQGVSVTVANNIVPLQLTLQDQPTYQHLGGLETRADLSMIVFGEENLTRLRLMFDTINGLARIEHNHAILGFLGIKNIITALCGMKYALPLSFDVETIPNMPHVYQVKLSFTDFDVFQQKRETLSSEQQQELVEAFNKRNPFLRIQQLWGAFNAYPDMPLEVRDDANKIIGHFDPDYYFKKFTTIEDDLIQWRDNVNTGAGAPANVVPPKATGPAQGQDGHAAPGSTVPDTSRKNPIDVHFGRLSETGEAQKIVLHSNGFDVMSGETAHVRNATWAEPVLANTVTGPYVDGLTPPSQYAHPHLDGQDDPAGHFTKMLKDTQYRDRSGRMARAFPTYMLWLIDEGGLYAGIKLFDNFYGLQSVVDLSIVRSEDIMADTLVLRLSNLYSRLSTPFKDLIDPNFFPGLARVINTPLNKTRNLASGLSDYLVRLDTIKLQPGIRVHLRMGYSANPNALDTVFNGTVTQVETGDVLTIVAQSDAVELGAIVNSKHKKGDSGSIDGSLMSGLWMSEPRDLMIRLLSMGGSVYRESVAYATQGMIFSENRYGVRHFGSILYEGRTDSERNLQNKRKDRLYADMQGIGALHASSVVGGLTDFLSSGVFNLTSMMWQNFESNRDYELYKRNIYPGNGLGIAQYLGGDLGDGPGSQGFAATGINPDGTYTDPITGEKVSVDSGDPKQILKDAQASAQDAAKPGGVKAADPLGHLFNGPSPLLNTLSTASPFLKALHITSPIGETGAFGEKNGFGFHEVSFRAQTYMKSIWDLCRLCAGLLPNYIVSVRPFMDRSTLFYGKPHWTYTSGVIPISTGIDPKDKNAAKLVEPDQQLAQIMSQIQAATKKKETNQQFYDRLTTNVPNILNPDPTGGLQGIQWTGGDIHSLPLVDSGEKTAGTGIALPVKHGKALRGLHLPTDTSLVLDESQHLQVKALLPVTYQHPFYMARKGGAQVRDFSGDLTKTFGAASAEDNILKVKLDALGGSSKNVSADELNQVSTVLDHFKEDEATAPGELPDSGNVVPPNIEEFYIAMNWDYNIGGKDQYYLHSQRILAYNTRTHKGCICAIGDKIPPNIVQAGYVALLSPDVFVLLQSKAGDDFIFGFVDSSVNLGPITSEAAGSTNMFATDTILPAAINVDPAASGTTPPASTTAPAKANALDRANIPQWMKDAMKKHPATKEGADATVDPSVYALRFGWNDPLVPVNFTDPSTGLVDPVGETAEEVFGASDLGNDKQNAIDAAKSIWNQFRRSAVDEKYFISIYAQRTNSIALLNKFDPSALAQTAAPLTGSLPAGNIGELIKKTSGADLKKLKDSGALVSYESGLTPGQVNTANAAIDAKIAGSGTVTTNSNSELVTLAAQFGALSKAKRAKELQNETLAYHQNFASFMQFLWQNPYNRGWLVKTADTDFSVFSGTIQDAQELGATAATGGLNLAASFLGSQGVPLVGDIANSVGGWAESALSDLTGGFLGSDPGPSHPKWNFDRAHGLYNVWLTQGPDAATSWMLVNSSDGKHQTGTIERATEMFIRDVFDPVAKIAHGVFTAFAGVLTGVVNVLRFGMMGITMGLGLTGIVQQQANILNRTFNDSIYYSAGSDPNSLLRLADNAFTREYGEPVVEVREPFQRIHHINSFSHILSNGIQENSDGVATIITATSNGNHPVTVHFDKGAPVERQYEKQVETGIWFDKPSGIVGDFLHPVQALRNLFKNLEGTPDEILAKRVALWHLKENLQNIYTGEIVVLGDPGIRPYDLISLGDIYESMYGIFEVEQVVHHFSPETGFVTSITPNALVMINDPAKWNMMHYLGSLFQQHLIRNQLRHSIGVKDRRGLHGMPTTLTYNDLGRMTEGQILGGLQYTGGMSALAKDVGIASGLGMITSGVALGPVAGAALGFAASWGASKWVINNLLDQHGCYIQYLNRNGAPMDAGLNYNNGVAVGSQNVITLFGQSLRIPIPVNANGNSTIKTNDILHNLGWQPAQIDSLASDVSLYSNELSAKILKLTNRQPDGVPLVPSKTVLVTVTGVDDGMTIRVSDTGLAPNGVRLGSIVVPPATAQFAPIARDSKAYAVKRLLSDPVTAGFSPTVALRINPDKTKQYDKQGHLIAWVFHTAPAGTSNQSDRDTALLDFANRFPQVEWDSYLPDGRPYTYNWETVLFNHANIDRLQFELPVPGQGAVGAGNR